MTTLRTVPFGVPLALAVIVAYYLWELRRSRTLLLHWAERKSVEIIYSRRRWVFKGPFFWKSTSGQVVFRVRVRDLQGHELTGWVLCGNFVAGMTMDQTSAMWDRGSEPAAPENSELQCQPRPLSNHRTAAPNDYELAGRAASAQLVPILRWALRSPLRMILALVGVLLAIVALIFMNYWISLHR